MALTRIETEWFFRETPGNPWLAFVFICVRTAVLPPQLTGYSILIIIIANWPTMSDDCEFRIVD
jgi:hypothetical protein